MKAINFLINHKYKLYDELEYQKKHYILTTRTELEIKECEEAIKELEELNNRSCDGCTHFTTYKGEYGICKIGINNRKLDLLHNSFCCNVFESK